MSKYAIYLNYTPTGKWVFVGGVPVALATATFDSLSKAKRYAISNGYSVEPNGKLILN